LPRKITIEEIQLFGAISAFMSKLYDRTHVEERTHISQFICEATAKECVEHIRSLSSEEKVSLASNSKRINNPEESAIDEKS